MVVKHGLLCYDDDDDNNNNNNNNNAVIPTAQTNKGIRSALIMTGFILIIVSTARFPITSIFLGCSIVVYPFGSFSFSLLVGVSLHDHPLT